MGKAKLNIPMCTALVLLLLTMISIHLTSGLYARYVATATGEDSARVAKFDVVTKLDNKDITLDCTSNTTSGTYTLTVQNNSEVSVKYDLYVKVIPKKAVTDQGEQEIAASATDTGIHLYGTDLSIYFTETRNENKDPSAKGPVSNPGSFQFTGKTLNPKEKMVYTFEVKYNTTAITGKVDGQEFFNWDFDVTAEIQVTQVD